MTNDTLVKTVFFAASRDVVWSYLTEKDKLAIWFHEADQDLTEGEPFNLLEAAPDGTKSRVCWGTVQKMVAPEELTYSFTIGPLEGALTKVTWRLEEMGAGTQLTLTHEGIAAAAGEAAMGLLLALDKGWDAHLARLRESAA
ncbi:MAG: SRPBCC domain-containing protein [Sneathiella sp.]